MQCVMSKMLSLHAHFCVFLPPCVTWLGLHMACRDRNAPYSGTRKVSRTSPLLSLGSPLTGQRAGPARWWVWVHRTEGRTSPLPGLGSPAHGEHGEWFRAFNLHHNAFLVRCCDLSCNHELIYQINTFFFFTFLFIMNNRLL